ncbi:MAG: hypothetical protein PHN89_03915 [Candidatus Pacebacteria bacterium]|nr:hypothetical protein [Candidatus Paceibacterota bacterium]
MMTHANRAKKAHKEMLEIEQHIDDLHHLYTLFKEANKLDSRLTWDEFSKKERGK